MRWNPRFAHGLSIISFFRFFCDDHYPLFRGQFVSLIDGMLGDCGSEVACLSKELELSQEALKRTEAMLQTIENAHAAQTSQLEVQIGDLERDLEKTASSLLKMKKENKHKSSEVRRL
ncbi:Uncharacterized protein Rs2_45394 [Raphanus sativus]|nr:Uncharacterized protein Rs2_45394 [Raphanus sativus]